ncbi:MAG: hypothetical protein LLG14_19255 [Nocardiaceae bacterium]|nr:hypothetical protein [Nocardiaceae bacterium]
MSTRIVSGIVDFLESGNPPEELFAPDIFCDLTMPLWRAQARGVEDVVRQRKQGHPGGGQVEVTRWAPTPDGLVMEFTEHWNADGQRWYAREMAWVDVVDDQIKSLSVYCTGDWDEARQAEHARTVSLIRP